MMHQASQASAAFWHNMLLLLGIFLFALLLLLLLVVFARRILVAVNGLSYWAAIGTSLLLVILGAAILLWPQPHMGTIQGFSGEGYVPWVASHSSLMAPNSRHEVQEGLTIVGRIIFVGLLPLLGIPFLAMLVQKWLGSRLTEVELQPGAAGIRAWLRLPNLVWVAFISVGLWLWLDIHPLTSILGFLMALSAYPGLRWAASSGEQPRAGASTSIPEVQAAANECDQVLRMVEEHKISAEEGAQLLNALAAVSRVPEKRVDIMSAGRKLTLAGAGIVLIAFFLPWYSINPAQEISRVMGQDFSRAADQFGQMARSIPGAPNMGNVPFQLQTATITYRGGDIGHGLGWIVLLLCVAVAALPFLGLQLDLPVRRMVEMGALAVAAVVLLYVLTSAGFRGMGIGLVLALAGLIVEVFGVLRERHPAVSDPCTPGRLS